MNENLSEFQVDWNIKINEYCQWRGSEQMSNEKSNSMIQLFQVGMKYH